MAFRCSSCAYASDSKSHLFRHISRKGSTCTPLSEASLKAMVESAEFPCRHPGCTMKYTICTNRLRHEKKCVHKPHPTPDTTTTTGANGPTQNVLGTVNGGDHTNVIVGNENALNNVNVTININGFDDFKPSEISRQKFVEYMASGATNVILKCLEAEQFNLNKPENMNVFISNLKDKIARVYDGCRWRVRNGDVVIEQVLENYVDMVNDSIDEFEEDANQGLTNKIARWRKNVDKEEFENYVKQQLLYQLYDLRDIVKDTHNVRPR